ncbi:Putative dipeptidase [hydrothermal vent metagenome]|uniref:Dipeptidase n=1 Tax=hydrothermal vent metagenome TaxID=652676 RepID=A0A3B0SK55_9ZZZZ
MTLNKRELLTLIGAGGVLGASSGVARAVSVPVDLAKTAKPISVKERLARVARVQELMRQQGVGALLLEAGSALVYFTGIRWRRSERFTGAIIPADGDIAVVTPYFEEPSVRESMSFGEDVRTWHEHENPFALVAGILKDRGLDGGKLAIEETVRHFIVVGVQQAAPKFEIVSGAPVTRGVRMFKSAAELALLQISSDITMAAYRAVYPQIAVGQSAQDISKMMNEAIAARGGQVKFTMALLGEASAYPHGTGKAQFIREGEVVLMDCGCSVHDYQSDISRSFVFGEPTKKQRKVWNTVKRGQELALETMQIGTEAGKVDDVVRAFYEQEGYGPGYKTPGLSHRLGHGIGMDGHEPVNFVHGETTALAPGMCFSNEPGIYIFGEFGIRLEDCLYITGAGPKLFSALSPSIDTPFG